MRAGALGDVLLLRPSVAALKRIGARVVLMAPEGSGRALVGPAGSEVEGLIPWDRADLACLLTDRPAVPAALRRELEAFDLVIACTKNETLSKNLAGLVPSVFTSDPAPPPGGVHAARCLAACLARLGLEPDMEPPACLPLESERGAAAATLALLPPGFVAVHPGSGSPGKNWPAASFASLVDRLAGGGAWLLVEGPADAAAASGLRERPGAVTARDLPPRALGALLSRCGLFVGNDSGVSHLAAAFGAPVVALFGPTDPGIWSPLGANVRPLRSSTGSMNDLVVEEVEAACLALRSAAAGLPGC